MANPLGESNIFLLMKSALSHETSGSSGSVSIISAIEALALFTHSCMLALDFRLVGLSEDDSIKEASDRDGSGTHLPSSWSSSTSFYSFRYAHTQSAMQFLIKINRIGSKGIIMGLGMGDEKVVSLEIILSDYFSESYFPHEYSSKEDWSSLRTAFNSESRVKDLISLFKLKVIQPLIPGLQKDGYQETGDVGAGSRSRAPGREEGLSGYEEGFPRPHHEQALSMPLRVPPDPLRNPNDPPGFEDEFELLPHQRHMVRPGFSNPLSIGHDDLNPPGLGRHPRLTGPFFGEDIHGGEGMYPSPSHPMFGGRGSGNRPRSPPGSRYDPVGPGDLPNRPSGGFPRGGPFGDYGPSDFI